MIVYFYDFYFFKSLNYYLYNPQKSCESFHSLSKLPNLPL